MRALKPNVGVTDGVAGNDVKRALLKSRTMDVLDVQNDLEAILDQFASGRLARIIITRSGIPAALMLPIEEPADVGATAA